jgi:(S)-mandelate dehydrogenase
MTEALCCAGAGRDFDQHMAVTSAINYDDLRRMAKRRLPRIAFDFIDGGVDAEEGLVRNTSAYTDIRLVPKYMVNVDHVDQSTTLFGRTYARPFGIAPTGGAALFRPGADMMLASAAKAANIPFIMSGASTATMEELAQVAPDHGWYQLYMARDRKISDDMIRRADACGFQTLVLTVDVPGRSKRERNIRNGFDRPLKPTVNTMAESLLHPAWLYDYFTKPGLSASNWETYAPPGSTGTQVLDFLSTQFPIGATWDDVAHIRKIWPRNFVIKGIMHPDDARRAVSLGVDGIIVSNHGGRQLDRSPSPIEVFPAVRDAVGEKVTLMLDSGIRRGADIVTALCLGAKFTFVGRWTLFGVAAGAEAGATHAVDMVSGEVGMVMAQMGAPKIETLGPDFLFWESAEDLKRNRRP